MSRKFITLELTEDEITKIINSLTFADHADHEEYGLTLIKEIQKQIPAPEQRDK